jgi:hypothetical protein
VKVTSFAGRLFADLGLYAGLPNELPGPDVMTTEVVTAGGPSRPSAPMVGIRTAPVIFQVAPFALTTVEETLSNLLALLDVLSDKPRQLVAERNDGTEVAVDAFAGPWVKIARNQLSVTFYMREPIWRELAPTTATKVFTGALDNTLAVPVAGQAPAWPRIRIQPTAQRTTFAATVGWRYRVRFTITNTALESMYYHPYRLNLGSTTALVSGSKALSNGNDVRVIDAQGREMVRELVTWNTGTSYAWIIIPQLRPGESTTFDVIYGNPSAGAPPTFTYSKGNPYKTTIINYAASSNSQWVYDVERIAANVNRGLWWLSPGNEDHLVPGAWARSIQYKNMDDFAQDPWTYYEAPAGTGRGIAILRATRYKRDVIPLRDKREYDGVMLHVPTGINSLEYDLKVVNELTQFGANLPVGRVELFARYQGTDWAQVWIDQTERRAALGNTTIGPRTQSVLNGSEPATHIMMVNGPYDGNRVPRSTEYTKHCDVENNTVWKVNLASTVSQSVAAEEEIVDVAGTLRIGGGQTGALAAPRDEVLVGQPAGRRLLVPYRGGGTAADEVYIETDGGALAASIYSADGLTKQADVSWAVASQRVEWESGEEATRIGVLPTLRPGVEQILNTTFNASITTWQHDGQTAGVTAATSWDSGTLKLAVTGNTGGTGGFARAKYGTDIPITPGERATFAADVQTDNLNVVPELFIVWVDGTGTEFAEVNEPDWTPTSTSAIYRRMVGGVAPIGTVEMRYKLRTRFAVANATGAVFLDNVSTTGNDAVWTEPASPAGTRVSVDIWNGTY